LEQIEQRANGLGRTRIAADFTRDCECGSHGDGRTLSHDADDEAGLQLRVKTI
jgi:hypothetical protein